MTSRLISRLATNRFEIEIKNQNDVVVLRGTQNEAAGVLVEGTVVLTLLEPTEVQSVRLVLSGVCRVRWLEGNDPPGTQTTPVQDFIPVLHRSWNFLSFNGREPHTIKAGTYRFDFHTILPGSLPESVEHGETFVRYRLSAVVKRPRFAHDLRTSKSLHVVRVPPPDAPSLVLDSAHSGTWNDAIGYAIRIPAGAVPLGTTLPLSMVLVPKQPGLRLGWVQVQLLECVRLETRQHGAAEREFPVARQLFTDAVKPGSDGDDEWRFAESIRIPPSLNVCVQDVRVFSYITVTHRLRISGMVTREDAPGEEPRQFCVHLGIELFISPQHDAGYWKHVGHPSQMPPRSSYLVDDLVDQAYRYAPPRYGDLSTTVGASPSSSTAPDPVAHSTDADFSWVDSTPTGPSPTATSLPPLATQSAAQQQRSRAASLSAPGSPTWCPADWPELAPRAGRGASLRPQRAASAIQPRPLPTPAGLGAIEAGADSAQQQRHPGPTRADSWTARGVAIGGGAGTGPGSMHERIVDYFSTHKRRSQAGTVASLFGILTPPAPPDGDGVTTPRTESPSDTSPITRAATTAQRPKAEQHQAHGGSGRRLWPSVRSAGGQWTGPVYHYPEPVRLPPAQEPAQRNVAALSRVPSYDTAILTGAPEPAGDVAPLPTYAQVAAEAERRKEPLSTGPRPRLRLRLSPSAARDLWASLWSDDAEPDRPPSSRRSCRTSEAPGPRRGQRRTLGRRASPMAANRSERRCGSGDSDEASHLQQRSMWHRSAALSMAAVASDECRHYDGDDEG